jgi:site-specific DNA-cytosine methylase
MDVLSLFDGMSCGQIALGKAGVCVDNYYASEIDNHAIKVTQNNYPNTIQLGTVLDWRTWELPTIQLLLGGSPCQSLSIAQSKTRQNLNGKSKLFFDFVDIKNKIKSKYFLFENVASMTNECKNVISELLGCKPIKINSNCFVAQDRPRYYWTNIKVDLSRLQECSLSLKNIMQPQVDEKYYYDKSYEYLGNKKVCAILDISGHDILKRVHSPDFKSHTLTTCGGGNTQKKVFDNGRVRKLTPLEYERLQGVPDNYTDCVSDTARYTMLGNGWTVDVIAWILSFIKIETE